MNYSHQGEFNPFSEESLSAVELVEYLPDSIAFEHVMYDNRIRRTATYDYSHKEGQENDLEPLVIDEVLMMSQFPPDLKDVFPSVKYTIKQLEILQVETKDTTALQVRFLANDMPHVVTVTDEDVEYETFNDSLDKVYYQFEREAIIGLLAAFVYAKQYDPRMTSENSIHLEESSIVTARDSLTDLTERMIKTLGSYSGHSSIETESIFDSPSANSVVASLVEQEFPDKSAQRSSLLLSEFSNTNDIPTAIDTIIYQNSVTMTGDSPILGHNRISLRYAEQTSTVLKEYALPTSELIDPQANYERWVHTCLTFNNLIKIPMSVYLELDELLEPNDSDERDYS